MREVKLYGTRAVGRVALVDDADYDLVSQFRWNVNLRERPGRRPVGPYANSRGLDGKWQFMHVLIMGFRGIDHIDNNGLNNQRGNLRPASQTRNSQNTRASLNCASPYKGVCWDKAHGRWTVHIQANGKRIYLGRYVDEVTAAHAYDAAARDLFGQFAKPNFGPGGQFPDIPAGAVLLAPREGSAA